MIMYIENYKKSKKLSQLVSNLSKVTGYRLLIINGGEGVEKREPSYTVGGNAN